jgi:hypothetical protein
MGSEAEGQGDPGESTRGWERPLAQSGEDHDELVKAWKEKRIEKEEKGEDSGDDSDSQGREDPTHVEINMMLELPKEFHFLTAAHLDLGVERVIF